MRKYLMVFLAIYFVFLRAAPVQAQTDTPPQTPTTTGVVTGTIVNRSAGGVIPAELELMVHAWNQETDLGMFHGKSIQDGTFRIEQVPLEVAADYLVMAVYKDVTYSSASAVYQPGQALNFEVPIYESTSNLSRVQIDQMHIVFSVAPDGLDVKQVYTLSNLGDRTIKDAVLLDDGSAASFKFYLPEGAEYIFFKPDSDNARFVRFSGGFADKTPLLPGEQSSQFMVSYLLPDKEQTQFSLTAPLNIGQVNILTPLDSGPTLSGSGLNGPETTALQDGSKYLIYSYPAILAGEDLHLSISGVATAKAGQSISIASSPGRLGLVIGSAFLGLAMIALGLFWWGHGSASHGVAEANDNTTGEDETLESLISDIARLDDEWEQDGLDQEDYLAKRAGLMRHARALMS